MTRTIATATAVAVMMLTARAGWSQTTRTEDIEQQKSDKAAEVQPPVRETGDLVVTKLENIFMPEPPSLRPTLGDFRPGAGFALGLETVVPAGEQRLWTTSGAWSDKNFKQAETSFETPIGTDHLRTRFFAKWEDEPQLTFYGLGMSSTLGNEVGYGLQTQEAGLELQAHGPRWFSSGVSASDLRITSNDGAGSLPPVNSLPGGVPGIGSSLAWWHSTAYAAIDTRRSPGYTDSGALYRVALHDYEDRDGSFDFTRTEIDLRQFVPLVHDNWIVAFQARADLTPGSESVPYFLMPSIGGRDTLPGFNDYRFTDKNSLLLRSELRWTATSALDMAVFYDRGTVADTARAIDLHEMSDGWGIGARFHGPTFTALRVEVAHSVEGWRYDLAHNISF